MPKESLSIKVIYHVFREIVNLKKVQLAIVENYNEKNKRAAVRSDLVFHEWILQRLRIRKGPHLYI